MDGRWRVQEEWLKCRAHRKEGPGVQSEADTSIKGDPFGVEEQEEKKCSLQGTPVTEGWVEEEVELRKCEDALKSEGNSGREKDNLPEQHF